ncbi:SCO2524 family protein [Catenuloplanes atrovinosus]|uniref:Uncharacterized protein n=1 Tax=Catenuloplanes atrovinosus TaxID=137266 RepID=A0AAE4CA17_9ACTN|nr:SCO2524 family protein [Catenuloplanes atrovinosus]MDR7277151.1 hypothetical protein [Catenuloplanes atrovinosus]
MRLRPEDEIRAIWRTVTRHCFRDGGFIWGDPRTGDSVNDAEQLLCILAPATELPSMLVDRPDATDPANLAALQLLGAPDEVPIRLARTMHEYLLRWRDERGDPVFSGGRYLPAAPGADLLDGYVISVRFSLAAIGFCKVLHSVRPDTLLPQIIRLASMRLTAAMVGLLRSFSVHFFDEESPAGHRLRALVHQQGRSEPAVLAELTHALQEIRVGVFDMLIGVNFTAESLASAPAMFDMGWTWGVISDAPQVETLPVTARQPAGIARDHPDPGLTLLAVEAITGLFSQRTRLLTLLDEEQNRLSRALQLRYDLARNYWSNVATFGDHRWPLERGPWTATDGSTGDRHTVAVAGLTAHNLRGRRGSPDVPLAYLLRACADIGRRHGVVRPPLDGPPAVRPRAGAELVPAPSPHRDDLVRGVGTVLPDLFAVLLHAAGLTDNGPLRRQYEDLADVLWEHVAPGAHLAPDWRHLLRVTDGLTHAVLVSDGGTVPFAAPLALAHQLMTEADELAAAIADDSGHRSRLQARLDHARRLTDRQPGTAVALLTQVILELVSLNPDT